MNIDSILAIAVFVLVITWSFTYYFGMFEDKEDLTKYAVEIVGNKIMNYISVDTYSIPVSFESTSNLTSHAFYFDYLWKNGTGNSSRVLSSSGSSVDCELYGNGIYWTRDITDGETYDYEIMYAAADLPQNCTETTYHSLTNRTKVIPHAEEKTEMISRYKMDLMNATSYYQFKSEQGIAEDFRVEITTQGSTFVYGIPVPQNRNVYSVIHKREIWESGKDAEILINLW